VIPAPRTGIDLLRGVFDEAGLAIPPLPSALRARIQERSEWTFSTRKLDWGLYGWQLFLTEVIADETQDYAAVGHAGHGANSYAISYFLVTGPLAVFVQVPWGGVYMDRKESAAEVRASFDLCADLIEAVQGVARTDSERLMLVYAGSTGKASVAGLTVLSAIRTSPARGWKSR